MKINKELLLLKELELEVEILKNNLNKKSELVVEQNRIINDLQTDCNKKEKIINDILNSRTFKLADKIGKFLKWRKK